MQFLRFANTDLLHTYVPNNGRTVESNKRRRLFDLAVRQFLSIRKRILVKAEDDPGLLNNAELLEELLYALYPVIGSRILEIWGFSDALTKVPNEHLTIDREGDGGKPDYVDVVQAALLQTIDDDNHPLAGVDKSQVPALQRLGMGEGIEEISMTGGVIEVEEIRDAIF